ncbi:MAG: hypothetical protein RR945_01450 [Erysipelotrichaceae bacterium]
MSLSIKECIVTILAIIVCFTGLHALRDNLDKQGNNAEKMSEVVYVDNAPKLQLNGLLAENNKQPILKENILHLKRGDYASFDYKSLPNVIKWDGTGIDKKNITYQGEIDGHKEGVTLINYTIYDDDANFLNSKIAVVIEGSDSNEVILDYTSGKFK